MFPFGLKQVQKLKSFSPETRVSKGFQLFNWLSYWLSGNVGITFKLSLIIWQQCLRKTLEHEVTLKQNPNRKSLCYILWQRKIGLAKVDLITQNRKKKTQNELNIVLFWKLSDALEIITIKCRWINTQWKNYKKDLGGIQFKPLERYSISRGPLHLRYQTLWRCCVHLKSSCLLIN